MGPRSDDRGNVPVTGVRRRRYLVSSRITLTVVRVSTFIDQAKRNVKSGMGRSTEVPTKDLSHLLWDSRAAIASSFFRPNFASFPTISPHLQVPRGDAVAPPSPPLR